jgi:divalent metal cation (Fe/Co/Zn/Cd) transporter
LEAIATLVVGAILIVVGILALVWAANRLEQGKYDRSERLLVWICQVSVVAVIVGLIAVLWGLILVGIDMFHQVRGI